MKVLPYGLVALAMLAILGPTISFAESENEYNEMTTVQQRPASAEPQEDNENGENGHSSNLANSSLVLLVTAVATASVVGYSAWKVYKIRRKTTSKNVV